MRLITIMLFTVMTAFYLTASGVDTGGYDATIKEKTDLFRDGEKVGDIPEMALFRVIRIRDDWVFGSYKDVDTEEVMTGWIKLDAISDIDAVIEALKPEAENFLLDGERKFQEKNYTEAIRFLSESIERNPNQPRALILRAESYLALRHGAEAGRDFSRVITMAPQSPEAIDARLGRANLLIAMKRYENAVQDIKAVLEREPRNAEARLYAGNIHYNYGRFKEAVDEYTKGINADQSIASLFYKRGLAHLRLNMFEEARTDLARAVQMNPANNEWKNTQTFVEQQIGMLESITPEMAKEMLDIGITRRDDRIVVTVTNKSPRPVANVEITISGFAEDTSQRIRDETITGIPRGRGREGRRLESSPVEAHEIKFLPGAARGMAHNTVEVISEPYDKGVSKEGMKYYGYIVMGFINKQEFMLASNPRSLRDDFSDIVTEMRVKVQGEKAR